MNNKRDLYISEEEIADIRMCINGISDQQQKLLIKEIYGDEVNRKSDILDNRQKSQFPAKPKARFYCICDKDGIGKVGKCSTCGYKQKGNYKKKN